ncbi:hypothetical protein BTUL_0247g00010 [Botrytis tulipae]|uniref:Heterokaryon incompatibility domain-containing protein n=1 Tax=Botrytis tulipae TaxID=87230 RepID=A0A4Z1E6S8_9HELO|nr:hypothetical protein BTUL_0247g00010 [Botrytis tulipae]
MTLPRRLIDVEEFFITGKVRLVESRSIERVDMTKIKYATLSHCWGPIASRVTRTTSHNYDEHMEEIIISKLPQIFQDVILLTGGLDMQYIWIDSLCIVQDDPSDWQQQSAMMADIYAGSLLNISAAHGSDSHLKNHILDDWYVRVRVYSALRLTKEEDRLPAISGIASRIAERLRCLFYSKMPKYQAGIWSDSGVLEFLWSTDGTYRNSNPYRIKRPQTYVAPTWSWASISSEYKVRNENVIRWLMWKTSELDGRKQLQDHLFEIEDINCTVEGDNSYGAVSSGMLKVRGRLMLARDVRELLAASDLNTDHRGLSTMFYLKGDLDVDGW